MSGDQIDALRKVLSGPHMDTRQWVSFGTVLPEAECPDTTPVLFTSEHGPLVLVKLHPSGVKVVCRVANGVAGNGEGEWFPFIEHDEVLVVIPEGDEMGGCTIIGRLNNEIDKFPKIVAGQEVEKNNFAFKRVRTPYVIEFAETYLVRSAKYESFLIFDKDGAITASNGDGAFMTVGTDLIGFQTGDASCVLQIDVKEKLMRAEMGSSLFHLDSDGPSLLLTAGTMSIGTSGNAPYFHGTSLEQVLMLIQGIFAAMGTLMPSVVSGAPLAAAAIGILNAGLGAGSALPIAPYTAALTAALSNPTPPASKGTIPGVGLPGLILG